jgi:hypothetical protein
VKQPPERPESIVEPFGELVVCPEDGPPLALILIDDDAWPDLYLLVPDHPGSGAPSGTTTAAEIDWPARGVTLW